VPTPTHYEGAATAQTEVIGAHIQMMYVSAVQSAAAGEVRLLAVGATSVWACCRTCRPSPRHGKRKKPRNEKVHYGLSGSIWTILPVCWPSVHMLERTLGSELF
jgi:hypothetical protein